MGKNKKICSADHIVLDAAAKAYTNLGTSDAPTLQWLLENPNTGFLTYYYLTGKSGCSSKCRAEIFALAISALAKINYFMVPSYLQLTAEDLAVETPPAYLAYLILLYLLQVYVSKIDCACKDDAKKYNEIFISTFCNIDNNAVANVIVNTGETIEEVPVLNITAISSAAHYTTVGLGCQPINIVNAQVGGAEYIVPSD